MKSHRSCKNLCAKNFTYKKKCYVHEIAAVNLSKIYFLKNAKKTCKPNNHDNLLTFSGCIEAER